MTNSFEQETKDLRIFPVGMGGEEIKLGGTSWEKRKSNELSDFAVAKTDSSVERRAQNLNRIQENNIFNAVVSTRFVSLTDMGADVSTKEDVEEKLDEFFERNQLIRVIYGHVDVKGYLTELNVEEEAQNSNSVFRIDFNLLRSVPMSGSS